MNRYTLHVSGTHCPSCKILIEDTLGELDNIERVSVNLSNETVVIQTSAPDDIAVLTRQWTELVAPHGYALSLEKSESAGTDALGYSIPLGLLILAFFFWLQKSGIISFGLEGSLTPWSAALIGVIASLSSCLAVVGGLVLSLSANISQQVSTARPFLLFHASRVAGFFALGAGLGLIGSALTINHTMTAVLSVIVSFVIIILGINLLGVFRKAKWLQISLPGKLFDTLTKVEHSSFAPIILGAATFFLPCGFTQSMQLAALSSGSSAQGALIMGSFSLGTLPMLAALSFGSYRFSRSQYAPLFFKTAGVVVIGLGLFTLLAGLAGLSLIPAIF